MGDDDQPKNRRERRAAAREAAKKGGHLDSKGAGIKMEQPDRSGPKGKTLYEIAAERQALLQKGQPFDKQPSPDPSREDFAFNGEELGPLADATLYSFTLSMLHFTLDVLVYNQYRQEIEWNEIWARIAMVFPTLFFVIYILRSKTAMRFPLARQILFSLTSIYAGCYLIYSGNKHSYYAVMKRAPPVGAIWVYTVIELQLPYAIVSTAVVALYLWWNGFSAF